VSHLYVQAKFKSVLTTIAFRVQRKPTWGTCAGLILLAESANRTKKGGQQLIGGLDVRVNRNHFGRQVESFKVNIKMPFLSENEGEAAFPAVFIRAPVVERILLPVDGAQENEAKREDTVVAPSRRPASSIPVGEFIEQVSVLARLPQASQYRNSDAAAVMEHEDDIIAVKQGNVFGTSFHPELTSDCRIHSWWLEQVLNALDRRKTADAVGNTESGEGNTD
jgi:pyridoxal 5'-phosphate synthase pdxT subunit